MMDNLGEAGWWGIGWGWIIGLIVLIVIIWISAIVMRKNDNPKERSPLDILKERYARGEISREEFAVKKKAVS